MQRHLRPLPCAVGLALVLALGGCVSKPKPTMNRSETVTLKANVTEVSSAISENQRMLLEAPDYADQINLNLTSNADNVVATFSGSVDLMATSRDAERYVVDEDTLPPSPTFAQVDAAFNRGVQREVAEVEPSIPAEDFNLIGAKLPAVRTLILAHGTNGARAYQTLWIQFAPAP